MKEDTIIPTSETVLTVAAFGEKGREGWDVGVGSGSEHTSSNLTRLFQERLANEQGTEGRKVPLAL